MNAQQKSSGLFGIQQTNQPATNIFGSANTQPQPQQQQQQQGGPFGSLNLNQGQQKTQPSGLFGALNKDKNGSILLVFPS